MGEIRKSITKNAENVFNKACAGACKCNCMPSPSRPTTKNIFKYMSMIP